MRWIRLLLLLCATLISVGVVGLMAPAALAVQPLRSPGLQPGLATQDALVGSDRIIIETVRDNFDEPSYNNNDGTWPWAGPWVEINDDDEADSGKVKIDDDRLKLEDENKGIYRSVDLSLAETALLTFDYRRDKLDKPTKYITLDISTDGGATWSELYRFADGDDEDFLLFSMDITPYAAANSTLRLLTSPEDGGKLYVDNFQVVYTYENVPNAVDDFYEIDEDEVLDEPAPGVLSNDTSVSIDPLTATLMTEVTSGTLTLNLDGSFLYTPPVNGSGTFTFSYEASNGVDVDTATVEIEVSPVNDPPIAVPDYYLTNATMEEPLIVAAPGVLENDSDVDSRQLTAILSDPPDHGLVELAATGAFTYTPAVGFSGADGFSYFVSDGQAVSSSVVVELLVDTTAPNTVDWIEPVGNGEILHVNGEAVHLEVEIDPGDTDVDYVWFYRWDALLLEFVEIGIDYAPPYEWELDTSGLNFEWNEIIATAHDVAGNASPREFIWLFYDFQPRSWLPVVYFNAGAPNR